MSQLRIDQLIERDVELLARRIDPPEAKSAEQRHRVEENCHCHDQIDPICRRQKIDEPREVSISEGWLTAEEELMGLARERQYRCRAGGAWRVGAAEAWQ